MDPFWFKDGRFPLYLAPMAGVTGLVFRALCREFGADVTVTEFVSAEGVLQAWGRNRRYIAFEESRRPVGVQLFGAAPRALGEAARIIMNEVRPDFIDLNAGCPVPKVVGRNGGASLLKDLPLLQEAARAVVLAVGGDAPVTAKIRIGWDAESVCALEACQRLEEAGIAAIAVHGRTRSQQYGGKADWRMIDACASACRVPVVGNGDIASPEDVLRVRRETAVSGVMIGRAAMADPWIFPRAKICLATGEVPPPPSVSERAAFLVREAELEVAAGREVGEAASLRALRARLLAQARLLPGSRQERPRLSRVSSLRELREILSPWLSA